MAFNEVYTALQQGVVDGQVNLNTLVITMKYFEVVKFWVKNDFGLGFDKVVIAQRTWNRFKPEQQKMMQACSSSSRRTKWYPVLKRAAGRRPQEVGRDQRRRRGGAARPGRAAEADPADRRAARQRDPRARARSSRSRTPPEANDGAFEQIRAAAVRGGQGQPDAQALRLRHAGPHSSISTCRRLTPPSGSSPTAYETDPKQLDYVNELARLFRAKGFPVVWTYVAYMESGEDCGVWGTRTNTPDSLQNIKVGLPPRRIRRSAGDRPRARRHRQQAHGLGLPRDQPAVGDRLAPHRHAWSLPAGRRRAACAPPWSTPVAELPDDRSRGMRRRQAREPAFRQPLRHGAEVRRRGAGRRGARVHAQLRAAREPR